MNQITMTPAIVRVEGKTKIARQVSVIEGASQQALTACLSLKGRAGNAIRANVAFSGYIDVVAACVHSNYKPLAEMIAIRLGEPMMISNRASFESLPDFFEMRIMKAKLAKNEGMRTDKKTGAQVSGAKLATEMELKALVIDAISRVNEYHTNRKAEQQAVEA